MAGFEELEQQDRAALIAGIKASARAISKNAEVIAGDMSSFQRASIEIVVERDKLPTIRVTRTGIPMDELISCDAP